MSLPIIQDKTPGTVPKNEIWSASVRWLILSPIVLVVGLICFSPNFQSHDESRTVPLGGDFLQEWVAGKILSGYASDQLYNLDHFRELQHDPMLTGFQWDAAGYFPPVYPPLYYFVMSPLSNLEYSLAIRVWAVLSATLLVVVLERLYILFPFEHRNIALFSIASLVFVFMPVWLNFVMGQKGTLILVLFFVTFWLLKQQRKFTAGVVFGFLLFKPHLCLVLLGLMIVTRQWRFFLGWSTTAIIVTALSIACCGWELNWAFIDRALASTHYIQTQGYQFEEAHHLWGIMGHFLGPNSKLTSVFTWLAILLTSMGLWRIWGGAIQFESDSFNEQFSAACLGTVLLSPHFYSYDLVLLVLPLWLLSRKGFSEVTVPQNLTSSAPTDSHNVWLLGLCGTFILLSGSFASIAKFTSIQPSFVLLTGITLLILLRKQSSQKAVKPYPASSNWAPNDLTVSP